MADKYLLEDGSSRVLLEDGSSFLLLESEPVYQVRRTFPEVDQWAKDRQEWLARRRYGIAAAASQDIAALGALSITGAAVLNATGTLVATGALSITGAADLDATGALIAAGALSITGVADLDASGALIAAGALSITGVADLDATGSLVADGVLSITGIADLDATGTLTAAGTLVITGVADMDSSQPVYQVRRTYPEVDLWAADRLEWQIRRRYGAALPSNDIEAAGSLSITGAASLGNGLVDPRIRYFLEDVGGLAERLKELGTHRHTVTSVSNDLVAAGALSITGAADLDATGTLVAAGSISITGVADIDATGTLVAAGSLSITGAADLDAVGSLAAAGLVSIIGVSDLDATGALLAAGSLVITGVADLTAASANDISATGSLFITGNAELTAIGQLLASGAIVITGLADLTDGGTPVTPPSVGIGGSGGAGGFGKARRKVEKKFKKLLDDVVAEVMYRDLIETGNAEKAAKIVKPYAETKRVAVPRPESVNWAAVEQDASRIRQLVAMWNKLQTDRQIELDDEEWFLLGD